MKKTERYLKARGLQAKGTFVSTKDSHECKNICITLTRSSLSYRLYAVEAFALRGRHERAIGTRHCLASPARGVCRYNSGLWYLGLEFIMPAIEFNIAVPLALHNSLKLGQ